jgi:aspartate racemase
MKTLGVIGGMGPFATLDFFKKVLESSHVETDQEHLHILIDNYPQIPDRSHYLLTKENDPYPFILQAAECLINQHCDLICMPCNTAHYWSDQLKKDINGRAIFIDMIEAVKEYITKNITKEPKALIMGTHGLVFSRVYNKYFEPTMLIYPNENIQKKIMEIIKTIKSGKMKEANEYFKDTLLKLKMYKYNVLIAACTEIPLLLPYLEKSENIIDTNLVLAEKVVSIAYERI